MPSAGAQKKTALTAQQKERITFLYSSNVPVTEIAKEVGADGRQVIGYINTLINFRRLPAQTPQQQAQQQQPPQAMPTVSSPSPETFAMPTPSPSLAATAPQNQPAQPAAVVEIAPPQGSAAAMAAQIQTPQPSAWGQGTIVQHSGEYQSHASKVRIVVEREVPPDGILGEHSGDFTPTQVCETYGEGNYKVTRYEPGKSYGLEYRFKASAAYGAPRVPRRAAAAGAGEAGRPGFQRPWRASAAGEGEEENRPAATRPYSSFPRAEGSMLNFGAHGGSSDQSATAEAIRQMGNLHEKTLEQIERQREQGPESFMTRFLESQQAQWQQRLETEERRREQDRKDEEAKYERRRLDEREEYQRRAQEADRVHQRELERIKAEAQARDAEGQRQQKWMLDMEEKKLEVIKQEHKNREESLREELKRNREEGRDFAKRMEDEMKQTRDATASQIGESDDKIQRRIDERENQLEREHKLKERALEKESSFNQQLLDMKKAQIESSGGDLFFSMLNGLFKEASKGWEKYCEVRRVEALTPESQAAAIQRGQLDANIGTPRPEAAPQLPQVPAGAQPGQSVPIQTAAPKNGQGSGMSGAREENAKTEEQQMEAIIQDMLDKPFFKQVIKEWSLHVKRGETPDTFANMYMEWMRDPMDHEGRKATTMFANFIRIRDWSDMMIILSPKLDRETIAIFKSEYATEYYEGFKAMIVEQIRDYWEQFLANRQAQKAAKHMAETAPQGQTQEGETPK